MNRLVCACAAIPFTLLVLGCTVRQPPVTLAPVSAERWAGQLNDRDGNPHPGTYQLTLSRSPGELVGEYRLEGDRCLVHGQLRGAWHGAELEAVVSQGENRMELRAALSGESLFGTYRFTGGPCQGDWGSTMARPVAQPD